MFTPGRAETGLLWAWGSNANGAIGIVEEDDEGNPLPPEKQKQQYNAPLFIPSFATGVLVKTVACGLQHNIILTHAGEVYSWGSGSMGKLGHPGQQDQLLPKLIDFFEGQYVSQIAVGNDHSVALMGSKVYTWGSGFFGRLGHGSIKHEYIPKLVENLQHIPIRNIWAGGCNTFVQDDRLMTWVWGRGMHGQLGIGSVVDSMEPIVLHAYKFALVCPGERHVLALDYDGLVYTWGSNEFGQLGDATKKDSVKPKTVQLPTGHRAAHGASGRAHSAVVTKNGRVFVWGSGIEAQLGLGVGQKEKIIPTEVPGVSQAVCVSCGDSHTVVLTNNGTAYVWGTNKLGQLGIAEGMDEDVKEDQDYQEKTEHQGTSTTAFQDIEKMINQKRRGPEPGSPKKGTTAKPAPGSATKPVGSAKKRPGQTQQQQQQQQQQQASSEIATELWEPHTIRYLRGAKQISAGHFHTVCILQDAAVAMQLVIDNNIKSLEKWGEPEGKLASIKNMIDYSVYESYTPFHWATHRGHKEMLLYLKEKINIHTKTRVNKSSPLHIAVKRNHKDCVSLLLNMGIGIDETDSLGRTALHYAAIQGDIHMCDLLIQNKASTTITDQYKKKALDFLSLEKVFKLKASTNSYDVAIICTPDDKDFCKKVLDGIEVHHIKCSLNESQKYSATDFVRNSKAILFVVSDTSVVSAECAQQLKTAKDLKRHIYSIWKTKATLNPSLEAIIFRRQLVDFTEANKFRDSISALVAGLRNIFNEESKEEEAEVQDTGVIAKDTASFHPDKEVTHSDLTTEKMNYLYICHDHSDHKTALHLASLLVKHGFICTAFIDNSTVVQDLVIGCWAFLLIVSSKSAASNIVRDQIALAENRQKLILPVLVQKTPISFDPALAYTLARIPKFGFFEDETNEIDVFINKLVYGIRLAKKVTEKNDKIKGLREEVKEAVDKLTNTETQLSAVKTKIFKGKA